MSGKVDSMTSLKTVEEIIDMLNLGSYSVDDIIKYLTSPNKYSENGYSERWVYKLIKKARLKIEERLDLTGADFYKEQMNLMKQRLSVMIKEGNEKMASEYIKEMNKISGLYTQKIEVKGILSLNTFYGDEIPPDDETNDSDDELNED